MRWVSSLVIRPFGQFCGRGERCAGQCVPRASPVLVARPGLRGQPNGVGCEFRGFGAPPPQTRAAPCSHGHGHGLLCIHLLELLLAHVGRLRPSSPHHTHGGLFASPDHTEPAGAAAHPPLSAAKAVAAVAACTIYMCATEAQPTCSMHAHSVCVQLMDRTAPSSSAVLGSANVLQQQGRTVPDLARLEAGCQAPTTARTPARKLRAPPACTRCCTAARP